MKNLVLAFVCMLSLPILPSAFSKRAADTIPASSAGMGHGAVHSHAKNSGQALPFSGLAIAGHTMTDGRYCECKPEGGVCSCCGMGLLMQQPETDEPDPLVQSDPSGSVDTVNSIGYRSALHWATFTLAIWFTLRA